ncbi:ommochrome-binding protein-like [Pectinophora gossypiella]|uniref:ommochrome-binding protein-like n=1 Tax=Pectinophora gossypiella TaxID=13191 RepID=UPI00214F1F6A|nr:ommochrome-binding protein-like [Pectinophora gossypiella]
MRFILILCAVTIIAAKKLHLVKPKCDGVELRAIFHQNIVLATGLNRPYQLSYYKKEHELFFSNNVGNDTEDTFEIMKLKHGNVTTLDKIDNGFATAIDNEKQVAYFGGSTGIYRMNLETGDITKIIHNHNVWDMFFKTHLYFIVYPSQKLYKYTDNHGTKHKSKGPDHEKWIHEKIYQFAIDGDGDRFITNETGLFIIKNGTIDREEVRGETVFRAIEINHKGEAYFCGKNGIYVPDKKDYTLIKIAHVKNIFGLTFDDVGNVIYSNPYEIIKLLPSECKIVGNAVTYIPIPVPPA